MLFKEYSSILSMFHLQEKIIFITIYYTESRFKRKRKIKNEEKRKDKRRKEKRDGKRRKRRKERKEKGRIRIHVHACFYRSPSLSHLWSGRSW